jgi:hypothetical protein
VKTFPTFEEAYQHGKALSKKAPKGVHFEILEVCESGKMKVFGRSCGVIVKDATDRWWIELTPYGCTVA